MHPMTERFTPSQAAPVDGPLLVRRLRWIMMLVILFDIAITFLGQPASYWSDPASVIESNDLFRLILAQGWRVTIGFNLVYLIGTFVLVSILPWRLGLILLFSFLLGHYFGGCTWLFFRYRLGAQSFVIYGVILSILIVTMGFRGGRRSV
jgi:hypothetical protein